MYYRFLNIHHLLSHKSESPIVIEAYEEQIHREQYREDVNKVKDDFAAEEARLAQEEAEFAQLEQNTAEQDALIIKEDEQVVMVTETQEQQQVSELRQEMQTTEISQSEENKRLSLVSTDSGESASSMIEIQQEVAPEVSPTEQVTDLDDEEEKIAAQDLIQGNEFVSQELLELVSQSQQQEEQQSTVTRNQEMLAQIQSKFIPLDIDDKQMKEQVVTEVIPQEDAGKVESSMTFKEETVTETTLIQTQQEHVSSSCVADYRDVTPSVESVSDSPQDVSYEDVTATSQDYVNLLNAEVNEDVKGDVTSMDYEEQNRKLTFRQVSEETEVQEQQKSQVQKEMFIADEVKSQLDASQDEIATVMTQLNTSQEEIIADQQQQMQIQQQQQQQMEIQQQQQGIEEYDNVLQSEEFLTQSKVVNTESQPQDQQDQGVDDHLEKYDKKTTITTTTMTTTKSVKFAGTPKNVGM